MMAVDRNVWEPSNFNETVIKVLTNVQLLVNELCEYQNVRCNDKNCNTCSLISFLVIGNNKI